jgi:hypothetical protein
LVLLLVCLPWLCCAQNRASNQVYDSLLNSSDSLSIFELIDSLITASEPEKGYSQIAVRAGYNSNIVSTGRPFGLGQFGLSSGAAFYHQSGVFADATGYWSNEYDPSYFLTIASLGYMNATFKKWSFLAEYSHYFYNLSDAYSSVSYTDNLTATTLFEHQFLYLRFDYGLYMGTKIGHRFTPAISLNLQKKNWRGFRKISFYPSFSVMMGIEEIQYYAPLYRSRLEAIFRVRHNLPLFSSQLTHEFGIMNYAFSAPISIAYKNWVFLLNYTYNMPVKLPNEVTNLTDSGYLSFSLIRYFDVKSRKKMF